MKANYGNKDILLSGHGKEWSNVSREISEHTKSWLAQSGFTESMIEDILSSNDISIEVVNVNDNKGVALIVNNTVIGCPLIYDNRNESYDDDMFIVDCTLFFFHVKSEYAEHNVKFDEAIRFFYSHALENAKLLRKM